MAAVNWLCLVLAFVFISNNVCIQVDTNITNGNYTTSNINDQTLQQHKSSSSNEPENITQLDDSELSASERTRRLIPYMAFYVPVSELPINKQYANNNMQTATKQIGRPSATGSIGPQTANHHNIPIPQQYVHLKVTATDAGLSGSGGGGEPYLPPPSSVGGGHYHSSAGDLYHTLTYGGQQLPQQSQFHILPMTKQQIDNIRNSGSGGHSHHLLSSGPPGPAAVQTSSAAAAAAVGKGNNGNNAFVTYKEINPIRHKTVQHFPPLPTASSTLSSLSSASKYETIRQQQQQQHHLQQQQQQQKQYGINAGVYRPRTKQSKLNLTPFTPSNTVPGDFVPIVYTPLNNINNNINYNSNNNVIKSQANAAGTLNHDTLLNEDEKQYHKQQLQQQQQQQHYSPGPLTAPESIDAQQTLSLLPPHRHNLNHHQQIQPQQQQQHHHNPKQQSQYFSSAASSVSASNTDLIHEDDAAVGGGIASGNIAVNAQHHHHHHHQQNSQTIRPSTPQYIDYLIDEPKQSLDDEQNAQHHHTQLKTLKPTLGPPSHAFILVSTAAPYAHNIHHAQETYGSTLRPPYNNKPKIRLQPVMKDEKNVIYPIIRQPNPTERPQSIVAITPTPKTTINNNGDSSLKYFYANEEFGQKITATGAVKLKPSNKYESDNQPNYQQQQQQHNTPLQPLEQRPPTPPISDEGRYQQQTSEEEVAVQQQQQQQQQEQPMPPKTILDDPNELPDIRTSSLAEILHKLQKSNHLPHTLTPDNIDNSIKTLIRILNNLKQTQKIVANPPQHHEAPTSHATSPDDYDYPTGSEEEQQPKQQHAEHPSSHDLSLLSPPPGPNKHPGPSTGRPGIDYPNYAEIPQTSFDCMEQRYKGFFGDPETNCQVWHYCDLNGGKASFLCPNGTIFSQIALTCDWWFNVKCGTTTQLYVLNERLYKYILPFTPKFPEDYSGPLVDKYLAMKFEEMEEKMRKEKEKVRQKEAEAAKQQEEDQQKSTTEEDNHLVATTTEDSNRHSKTLSPIPIAHKPESVNSQVSEQSSERNLLIDDEVNDISQRGTIDTFDSTTISTISATAKSEPVSFSLKPIIVSSTIGPDYDEDQLQEHHEDKRSQDQDLKNLNKTENERDIEQNAKEETVKTSSGNHMQITVEKVNVIEIKPDGATGHLIRDMLLKSKKN